ncbi:MAG: M20/M25/M40 family metallo-hydrolase [Gemmatimonadota bacterium]
MGVPRWSVTPSFALPTFAILTVTSLAAGLLALVPSVAQAQTFRSDDPVLRAMWQEGMEESQVRPLAQVLVDSIGPRLSGTPGFDASVEWLLKVHGEWGVPARKEQYGTWRGWEHGSVHVDLTAPRTQTLDTRILGWSPGTEGAVEGDVVRIPAFTSEAQVQSWLAGLEGKIVLGSPAEPTCREPQALERLARPETMEGLRETRVQAQRRFVESVQALGQDPYGQMENAGAAAILTSRWSEGWGVNKVFGTVTSQVISLDVSCEDFGLLDRLATHNQGPRVRIAAEARSLGTVPMHNVMAEIRGSELPDEYVLLSAHLDSWHGATGATDNGTGTITMLEAIRILKETYPNPRRTILVGYWGGEEQGLIGSRAFAEDNPDIVDNLQVVFNQDNGTWRAEYIQAQGLSGASGNLARWVAQLPTEISSEIELDLPGPQETGGSDHVSFLCHGAPGWRLQSNYPDYRQYTWHTNRDTFDKIILDDLKNNATLAAMLAYLASEDPERVPRDRSILPVNPSTGEPREWIPCRPANRSFNP